MGYDVGLIPRLERHDERRQFAPREGSPQPLVPQLRRADYELRPVSGPTDAVCGLWPCNQEFHADTQRLRNGRERGECRHRLVAFYETEIANRNACDLGHILQSQFQLLPPDTDGLSDQQSIRSGDIVQTHMPIPLVASCKAARSRSPAPRLASYSSCE